MFKLIIETFDQLKKHNFDQVNFGQTTHCQIVQYNNLDKKTTFDHFKIII
jgi:hypothetical protein